MYSLRLKFNEAAPTVIAVDGLRFPVVLERAVRRDEAAFTELWRSHQPALLRYLRTMHPSTAEDLAAETWLAAARGLARFDGDEMAFRAWLLTIARRRVIDLRRSISRRPAEDPSALPEQGAPDAALLAEDQLSTESALALICRLPSDQAEVIVLRVIAGLDVSRVAAITGKRPGTVRVLAHRGLRRLRELVEPLA